MDILREALPGLQRVAILWNPDSRPASTAFQEAQVVATALGVALRPLAVRTPEDLEDRVTTAAREPVDALLVLTDALTVFHQERIAALAGRARLPAMFDRGPFAVAGGLLAYGPDILDLYRRVATYVDKIPKGAKPGDPPIDRPTKFDFVINLKTAGALGLTIPPAVLQQATELVQ
jgi:putative ABC transport system substrate-binding protein